MTTVRWVRISVIVLLILLVYFVAPVEITPHTETLVRGLISVVVLSLLAFGMVRQLQMHIDDTSRRIDGLVVGIVLVVVVFSHTFYVLEQQDPGQFVGLETKLDSLYFAMTTLVTVGTGDVHAAGQLGRALVLVQMVFNVVFVATTATLLTSRIRDAAVVRAQARHAHQPDES